MSDTNGREAILSFLGDEPAIELETESQDLAYVALGETMIPAGVIDRVINCGRLFHKPDPHTGKRVGYYAECGQFLYCPHCLEKRAEAEKARVIASEKELKRMEVAKDEDSKVTRSLAADTYRRYPQEGMVVILTSDPQAKGESVSPNDLDWKQLTKTPKGSNISGKLGKASVGAPEEKDEDEDEFKIVPVPSFTADDPLDRSEDNQQVDFQECWEFATLATAHILPDLLTIRLAMKERMRHYRSALEERGYHVRFFVWKREKVFASKLDWQPYNNFIRKKLQRKGYRNEILDPEEPDEAQVGAEKQPKPDIFDRLVENM